jgi:chromatin remodeling complex protein RSC6
METETKTVVESTNDQLKTILQVLSDQAAVTKALINSVKNVLKDAEKQSKELDKLRNKKSRSSGERKASGQQSGITKPVSISDELSAFLGVEVGTLVPRNQVTKGVSEYVRKFNLYEPTNRQKFILTETHEGKALHVLLGKPEEQVTFFNLQRYLKHHYTSVGVPSAPKADVAKPVPVKGPEPVAEPEVSETPKPKKKILVVKKKVPLVEEA